MDGKNEKVKLKLFVSGATGLSVRAILSVKAACAKTDPNLVDLEIFDVLQSGQATRLNSLVPLPTLFVLAKDEIKKFIGKEIQNFVFPNQLEFPKMLESTL